MASAFFRTVKVLPISHGDGIYQKLIGAWTLQFKSWIVGVGFMSFMKVISTISKGVDVLFSARFLLLNRPDTAGMNLNTGISIAKTFVNCITSFQRIILSLLDAKSLLQNQFFGCLCFLPGKSLSIFVREAFDGKELWMSIRLFSGFVVVILNHCCSGQCGER